MKLTFLKYLIFALLLCPSAAFGQGRVYTRSLRLADFPQKTTRMVLSGKSALDSRLKEEISSRWRISPYEFCDYGQFKAAEKSTLYYFLHTASDADFTYLILTKGGPSSGNPLERGFDVVSLPIAGADNPDAAELLYMPAFIDLIQEYILAAMESDAVSYKGIGGIARRISRPGLVCKDLEKGRQLFSAEAEGAIVPVLVMPSGQGKFCYKMLISTDKHHLYKFKKKRL